MDDFDIERVSNATFPMSAMVAIGIINCLPYFFRQSFVLRVGAQALKLLLPCGSLPSYTAALAATGSAATTHQHRRHDNFR